MIKRGTVRLAARLSSKPGAVEHAELGGMFALRALSSRRLFPCQTGVTGLELTAAPAAHQDQVNADMLGLIKT